MHVPLLLVSFTTSRSEDEIDILLRGTPSKRQRVRQQSLGMESSSEDEFEKEMEKDLNCAMKCMHSGLSKGTV